MTAINWSEVARGTRIVLKDTPTMPVWFKFVGHEEDLIVTYRNLEGELRDAIVHRDRFEFPTPSTGTPS